MQERVTLGWSITLQLIIAIAIVMLVGAHAWDDGAITLAFSKTFAGTGRVALTPVSEQIEGFSSVSWFLLNAVIAAGGVGFAGAIACSQILSALCLSVTLVYLWLLAGRLQLSSAATWGILIFAALSGPAVAETANGMEMTLLAASGLAITFHLYFKRSWPALFVAMMVFLATRFEAVFYLPFLVGALVFEKRGREALSWLAVGGVIFAALGAGRYWAFADFLPNTIYAKMHPPYRVSGIDAIVTRIRAAFDLVEVLFPVLPVIAAFWLKCRKRWRPGERFFDWTRDALLISPILGVELFAVVSGRNWGYPGRMQFLAIPYALLWLATTYDRLIDARVLQRRSSWGIALLIATLATSWATSARQQVVAVWHALPHTSQARPNAFDVTPDAFRATGLAVDRLRQLLHRDSIVFLTPDVGGLGLCCAHVRVVDAGLLTNRILARGGYAAFPAVLRDEAPDVIEIHETWAVLSGIYGTPSLEKDYVPVLIDETRMYLRREYATQLLDAGAAHTCAMANAACAVRIATQHRYVGVATKEDDAEVRRFPEYLAIP